MLTIIEDGFFDLLQSDIVMEIDGVKYRSGKFLNFRIKEFYIQLDLIVRGKQRAIDIPIPYSASIDKDNNLILSYNLSDMGDYGDKVDELLKKSMGGGKSKLYNKSMRIGRSVEDE